MFAIIVYLIEYNHHQPMDGFLKKVLITTFVCVIMIAIGEFIYPVIDTYEVLFDHNLISEEELQSYTMQFRQFLNQGGTMEEFNDMIKDDKRLIFERRKTFRKFKKFF